MCLRLVISKVRSNSIELTIITYKINGTFNVLVYPKTQATCLKNLVYTVTYSRTYQLHYSYTHIHAAKPTILTKIVHIYAKPHCARAPAAITRCSGDVFTLALARSAINGCFFLFFERDTFSRFTVTRVCVREREREIRGGPNYRPLGTDGYFARV